jgi:LPS export ABC transporter permease LptF/LPS export ABC transporter permease LptG
MRHSWTISRYLIGAILPYFLSSWILLSVILFVQQAGRFADIFFSANIPSHLIWQLAVALIPNVIAFTCPMAVLVGTVIGLSKMQGDSELVAIRAAGVGNTHVMLPVFALGIVLSAFTFAINLYGVPLAARIVRQVAIQTAIYKLESPIEPGVFNTEVAGYTIYVRDGDITQGTWKNIFLHSEDQKTGTTRLITSKRGRIDSSDQLSELVLEDAVSTNITQEGEGEKFVSEKIGEIRYSIKTRRGELIDRLATTETSAEELGLTQLSEYARSKEGKERAEAEILWQRRILLGLTPMVFCLLGAAMVLRFSRGGRGFGLFISLLSLITYYLIAFLGEQLARTERIDVLVGGMLPVGVAAIAIIVLLLSGKRRHVNKIGLKFKKLLEGLTLPSRTKRPSIFVDLTAGLRDFDIAANLAKYFALTLGFLTAIFIIFTAFELWRFAGTMEGGTTLLIRYLIWLLPFIYLQLAPSAAMVAVLATFVVKSRQNEIVTWTSAGQSVYRLLAPCFVLMLLLGGVNMLVQEFIAPWANVAQEGLRQQIRSRGKVAGPTRFWVAEGNRIYSFSNIASASDNEGSKAGITIFEFADEGTELQALYRSGGAGWSSGLIELHGPVRRSVLRNGSIENSTIQGNLQLPAETNPFKELRKKPSQMNIGETREQIRLVESDVERRSFEVALEKKWTTLFLPFVIALFTAPFALSLNRKGKAATVGYAVALWLLYMGLTSAFDQFGLTGALPALVAVWGPLAIFAMLGAYLLSKVRT